MKNYMQQASFLSLHQLHTNTYPRYASTHIHTLSALKNKALKTLYSSEKHRLCVCAPYNNHSIALCMLYEYNTDTLHSAAHTHTHRHTHTEDTNIIFVSINIGRAMHLIHSPILPLSLALLSVMLSSNMLSTIWFFFAQTFKHTKCGQTMYYYISAGSASSAAQALRLIYNPYAL